MFLNIDLKNEESFESNSGNWYEKIINKTGFDIKANKKFDCKISAIQKGAHKIIFLLRGKYRNKSK